MAPELDDSSSGSASPPESEGSMNAPPPSHRRLRVVISNVSIASKPFYSNGAWLLYIMYYLFNVWGVSSKNMRREIIPCTCGGTERGLFSMFSQIKNCPC